MYRQPNDKKRGHPYNSREFNESTTQLLRALRTISGQSPDISLCGDFNLPHAKWPECSASVGATKEEKLMI